MRLVGSRAGIELDNGGVGRCKDGVARHPSHVNFFVDRFFFNSNTNYPRPHKSPCSYTIMLLWMQLQVHSRRANSPTNVDHRTEKDVIGPFSYLHTFSPFRISLILLGTIHLGRSFTEYLTPTFPPPNLSLLVHKTEVRSLTYIVCSRLLTYMKCSRLL